MSGNTKILIVGCFLMCCLASCFWMSAASRNQETTIDVAARRVGVEPTWEGLEGYIVRSVTPGMSREQVEQALSAMAPLEVKHGKLKNIDWSRWGPIACDDISLKLHPWGLQMWLIVACYDTQDQLVDLRSADPEYPQINIYATPQWW